MNWKRRKQSRIVLRRARFQSPGPCPVRAGKNSSPGCRDPTPASRNLRFRMWLGSRGYRVGIHPLKSQSLNQVQPNLVQGRVKLLLVLTRGRSCCVTTCTVVRAAPVGVRCSFSNDVLDNPSLILHGLSYTLSSLVTIFMSNPNNRGSAHLVHVDQQSVEHRNLRADAEILLRAHTGPIISN